MRSRSAVVAEQPDFWGEKYPLEVLALRGLESARQTNDLAEVTKNLSTLGRLYAVRSEPNAAKMFEEAAACARECYGENSLQEANELEDMALVLARAGNAVGAENARLKALAIRDSRVAERSQHATTGGGSNTSKVELAVEAETEAEFEDEILCRLNALDALAKFYIDQKRFDESEGVFLKLVSAVKAFFGPTSEEVEDLIPHYAKILRGLNRIHELRTFTHNDSEHDDCTSEKCNHAYSKEVIDILKEVEDARATDDLQVAIGAHRDAVQKLQTIIDNESAKLPSAYPFLELERFQTARPQRSTLSALAQILRRQWGAKRDDKLLTEAAGILRNLVKDEHVFVDGMFLMLTLSNLCSVDNTYEAELEQLSANLPKCAATLYTRALARFRKYGSTPEARKAMKAALKQNPYVPMAIAEPCEESEIDASSPFEDGTRTEAAAYAYNAGLQWRTTPGALSFMFKVFGVKVPDQHIKSNY